MVLSLGVGNASVGTRGHVSKQSDCRWLGRLAFWVLGVVKCCGVGCEITVLWVDERLTLGRTWETENLLTEN